jgi:HEAT repeat protein
MTVFTCRDEAIAALTGPDADARKAAADYLADDGGDTAVQALVSALSSTHADVQINAAEALGNCRNSAAVVPLADVLRNNKAPDSTRQTAARSLGTLGHSEGIGPLIETIQEVLKDPEHTDHNVVRAAVRALGILGPLTGDAHSRTQVVDGLLALLDAHSAVLRQSAVVALAAYADPRSVKPLRKALSDESWLVRQATVLALAEVGGSEVGPAVEGMMNDSNRNVRIAAADALETLTRLGYGE